VAVSLSTDPRFSRRLVLTPFRRRDSDALHEAVTTSLPDLHDWLPWAQLNYGRSDASRFIRDSMISWRDGQAFDFAIRLQERPTGHAGNVSVWFVSRSYRIGEVGYWVRSDATRRGIATEAAARVLQIAYDELNLHRVILRIAIGNTASERVAEKLGFLREGLLREEIKVKGQWLDHTVWGLLENEYRKQPERYREWVEVPAPSL